MEQRNHAGTVSRRRFLASVAASGAAAMLPPQQARRLLGTPVLPWHGMLAQSGSRAQAAAAGKQPRRIDVQHHILPPAYMQAHRERILASMDASLIPLVLDWTPAKAVEEMDRNGVATAITSLGGPGIWMGDAQAARKLARACNEYAAQMVRDFPGRFGMFATVPLPDPEGSLKEIEYTLDVLKADGIGLLTSYGDKWPGDPVNAPVWEELNRRKAVVFFHPVAPACCRNLIPDIGAAVEEFLFDITRAITSLLWTGTLSRYPDIRFIFTHAGGTMPMLASRIQWYIPRHKGLAERLPHGVAYELGKLYYDVANSVNPSSMAALMKMVPTSQIVFGSDYPFVNMNEMSHDLDNFALSVRDRQAINRDNAERLFPRLKG